MVKKRSIVFAVIFSFVTFGLYGLYWIYKITNEMNTLLYKKDAMGGMMVLILTLITCGLYGFIWAYRLGENVDNLKRNPGGNSGILCLLSFFPLTAVFFLKTLHVVIKPEFFGIF